MAAIRNGGTIPTDGPPPPPLTLETFPLTHLWFLWVLLILWQFVTGWLVMMVSVSILTTLYGHYIEGRPLV